ncbi:hypothetical protein [Mesorhizobium caraganae]|uniref:hypothetical protein n=1 Tax=Mesorhizobium caraganae TaxID=483206 RepID=UPI003338D358
MDTSIILSFLLATGVVGIFSAYFDLKRQKKIKAESGQREEELREEARSRRKEAEGLRQELHSSSAALHESERQIHELTQTLSDPAQVFLDHLKDVRERGEHLSRALATAVSRANLEVENLVQKRRRLNRDLDPPLGMDGLVNLVRQASLTLENHAQQIAERRGRIEGLRQEVDGSRLHYNLQLINQNMSTFDDLMALMDSLCAPLTSDEKVGRWVKEFSHAPHLTFDGQRALAERRRADAENPKPAFERWRDPPLTPLDKFNRIKKAFGQSDGFG